MNSSQPLKRIERTELERLLAGGGDAGGFSLSGFDGFACAIVLGPNMISPTQWLDRIWGANAPPVRSLKAAQRATELVFRHYNAVVRAVAEGTYVPLLPDRTPSSADNRAQAWAAAFIIGMSLDDEWERLIEDPVHGPMMVPICLLAEPKHIVRDSSPNDGATEEIIAMLPQVVPIIKDFWVEPRPRLRTGASTTRGAKGGRSTVAPPSASTGTVHRLKVQLNDVRPPVWRRLEIESDVSLSFVSDTIIAAMGWTDSHLHGFRVRGETYGTPDLQWGNSVRDERRFELATIAPSVGNTFTYDYDYGDGWTHRVVVEAVEPIDPAVVYPRCIKGKRACPPEDCGGPYGYEQLLEALGDPKQDDHGEMLAWSGPIDPNEFDLEETNADLRSRVRSQQPKTKTKRTKRSR